MTDSQGQILPWSFTQQSLDYVDVFPLSLDAVYRVHRPLTRSVVEIEREFFIDNLLVRIHSIIVMIRWTGLAPWEFEFPFPGRLASTFLGRKDMCSCMRLRREVQMGV